MCKPSRYISGIGVWRKGTYSSGCRGLKRHELSLHRVTKRGMDWLRLFPRFSWKPMPFSDCGSRVKPDLLQYDCLQNVGVPTSGSWKFSPSEGSESDRMLGGSPWGSVWDALAKGTSDHEVMTSAMIIPDLCLQDWSKDGSQMSLGWPLGKSWM